MDSDNLFDRSWRDIAPPPSPAIKPKPRLKSAARPFYQNGRAACWPLPSLDQVWQGVMSLVQPFPTQMMLRQQCRLLGFDGNEARVSTTSQPLLKMVSDRLPNLEAAFTEFYGHPVTVSLEIVPAGEVPPVVMAPSQTPTPPPPVTGLPQSLGWEGSMAQSRSDYGFFGD